MNGDNIYSVGFWIACTRGISESDGVQSNPFCWVSGRYAVSVNHRHFEMGSKQSSSTISSEL